MTVGSGTVRGAQGNVRFYAGLFDDWYLLPSLVVDAVPGDDFVRPSDSTAVECAVILMVIVFISSYLMPKRFMETYFTNSLDDVCARVPSAHRPTLVWSRLCTDYKGMLTRTHFLHAMALVRHIQHT